MFPGKCATSRLGLECANALEHKAVTKTLWSQRTKRLKRQPIWKRKSSRQGQKRSGNGNFLSLAWWGWWFSSLWWFITSISSRPTNPPTTRSLTVTSPCQPARAGSGRALAGHGQSGGQGRRCAGGNRSARLRSEPGQGQGRFGDGAQPVGSIPGPGESQRGQRSRRRRRR